jgi:hypothetical protein
VRREDAPSRGGSGQPRELGVAGEASDAGDLADQLGRGQRRAAGVGRQPWSEGGNERGELLLECRDRARELADALEFVASDSDARGLLGALQSPGEALLLARAGEGAQRDLELGPEVVQLPAQIVDQRGALLDEPFAVIDEQPDIELGPSELRDRQRLNALADRRAGDRDRVDAIRLARLAGAVSRAGHQLWRDTHDAYAAPSKNRSSDPETCRQSSIAHTRSPPTPRAQRSS